ncbi:MAG: hypothetical protein ACFFEE_05040 [Candidatus Thorarchaeota archaeon]
MGSVWFSKKAFLYFGGAAVILLGGAIVLMSPYHYINFAVIENDQRTFNVWNRAGYYAQVEVTVGVRVGNSSTVEIDLVFQENVTLDTVVVNITLDEDDIIETPDASYFDGTLIADVPFGNYTVTIDRVSGANLFDLGLNQVSDSRLWVVAGGSMNIIGLIMGIAGYFVPGHFLPTDADTIVDWGYEELEEEDTYSGN